MKQKKKEGKRGKDKQLKRKEKEKGLKEEKKVQV